MDRDTIEEELVYFSTGYEELFQDYGRQYELTVSVGDGGEGLTRTRGPNTPLPVGRCLTPAGNDKRYNQENQDKDSPLRRRSYPHPGTSTRIAVSSASSIMAVKVFSRSSAVVSSSLTRLSLTVSRQRAFTPKRAAAV